MGNATLQQHLCFEVDPIHFHTQSSMHCFTNRNQIVRAFATIK